MLHPKHHFVWTTYKKIFKCTVTGEQAKVLNVQLQVSYHKFLILILSIKFLYGRATFYE